MVMDKFSTVKDYFNTDGLNPLLSQLKNIARWNEYLAAYLPEEKNMAQHCQLVRYENQELFAVTDSPHWVMRFRFHIPELIKKFRTHEEFHELKNIQCKAKPLVVKNILQKNRRTEISEESASFLKEILEKLKK